MMLESLSMLDEKLFVISTEPEVHLWK
jgi:hypothetical protein